MGTAGNGQKSGGPRSSRRADLRPELQRYFMSVAFAVRSRANCQGRRVGAILVMDDRVVSTGYNGTPAGMKNCLAGGCYRCAHPEMFASGTAYDICICVHAEQNCLLAAARFGIRVEGGAAFTTLLPCFGCAKELVQAEMRSVYYRELFRYKDRDLRRQHRLVLSRFPGGVHQVPIKDPQEEWARGRGAPLAEDIGHFLPPA